MRQGLIHIYTGEGKGKTTSAVGLGVRALRNRNEITYSVCPASPAGGLILFAPDCVIPKAFGMPYQEQK